MRLFLVAQPDPAQLPIGNLSERNRRQLASRARDAERSDVGVVTVEDVHVVRRWDDDEG